MAMKALWARDKGGAVFLALLLVVMVAVPLLNLVVPESSPLHLS
ncbi:MAG: hypothetical protein FD130_1033, partial [Halothiobacillaceae bacterium]